MPTLLARRSLARLRHVATGRRKNCRSRPPLAGLEPDLEHSPRAEARGSNGPLTITSNACAPGPRCLLGAASPICNGCCGDCCNHGDRDGDCDSGDAADGGEAGNTALGDAVEVPSNCTSSSKVSCSSSSPIATGAGDAARHAGFGRAPVADGVARRKKFRSPDSICFFSLESLAFFNPP